ncbi:MAG: response regulator [bacterium]
MYRVLIVDDEPIELKFIEYIINKKFTALKVEGTERSGRAAIEKAESTYPDIIIMDINMPGINGLEAMRQIRKGNPNVRFIVVSAFDYFNYAVEAVALNVDDYLLKPVKEATLVETLEKVMKQIDARRDRTRREMELKEKFEMVMPILETGFINAICIFDDAGTDLHNYCRIFDFKSTSGYVIAIQFGEKEGGEVKNKIGAGVQSQKLYQHYYSILKSICVCVVGPMMLNRLIVYILDEQENGFEQKFSAEKTVQNFYKRAEKLDIEISVGIGGHCKSVDNVHESYQQALRALLMLSISKIDCNILHFDDVLAEEGGVETCYEKQFMRSYYLSVDTEDALVAQLAFESIFSRMCSEIMPDFDELKNKSISLILGFSKLWVNLGSNHSVMLGQILQAQKPDELRRACCCCIASAVNRTVSGKKKKINSIIEKANRYMEEHFSDEITLDSIAKEVNLSPYYFSRFYKAQTGVNFIDRLMTIRIEKAKEYLSETDASIKEVSKQVGYMEPNYFSKLFKKIAGITATEYKEQYGR